MSLLLIGKKVRPNTIAGHPLAHWRNGECQVCPLNKAREVERLQHPKMAASGHDEPLVYMLGEAPGADEDRYGRQFVGSSGGLLRENLPQHWNSGAIALRWNNTIRCRPMNDNNANRDPAKEEIESCRPSIIRDIEATCPPYVFGFGGDPLRWVSGKAAITRWNGRYFPVKIGDHVCWYFALLHPAYIQHIDRESSLYEQMKVVFANDLKRACAIVESGLPDPVLHSSDDALADIERLSEDAREVIAALEEFAADAVVGIDLETKNTRPYYDDSCILTVALSSARRTVSFPLYHRDAEWLPSELEQIEDALIAFLQAPNCRKVSFALHFELEWLAYFYGHDIVHSEWDDAQAAAFILDEREGALSLEFVAQQYFGLDIKAINNTDRNNLDKTPGHTVLRYNAVDARYHRLTYEAQLPLLAEQELMDVYEHHVRRTKAAALCQLQGVPVNQDTAQRLHDHFHPKVVEVEQRIAADELGQQFKERTGHDYRPAAPQDGRIAFFDILGYEGKQVTEAVLEQIDHPLAKHTIDWRQANKVVSTYIRPILHGEECLVYPDGKLHPELKLVRTRTWRSSSQGPNIQNFPKHDDANKEIRAMIEAPPGYRIVSFDYGQIQARNVAMESKDTKLVQSFWDREDIHVHWRDRIFTLYPAWAKEGLKTVLGDKKLAKHYRNKAKNGFVFASFFGAGGRTVAAHLGIPEQFGYQLAEEFDDAFPEVADWHNALHEFFNEHGYITGLSGFRRRAPIAHTEIINTPIQSDEAVMVFDAMDRLCQLQEPRFYPALMIHDDLGFIWPKEDIDRNAEVVISTMLDCPFPWAHTVPISVEMSVGQTWDKMEEDPNPYDSDRWQGSLG